jgi:membrane protein YdbS with pleckstrin-like domain
MDAGSIEWRRVSRLAIARGTVKGLLLLVALTIGLMIYQQSPVALWLLALAPFAYLINLVRYNNLGYASADRYFHTRRGWLSRSTHIVPVRNAQAIVITEGPFDRWLGLASLVVDSAGQAYTGGGPRVSNLPVDQAQSVARVLAHKAAATRYRWG